MNERKNVIPATGTAGARTAIALAIVLGLAAAPYACASETSATHLPLGVNTALPALYPPVGDTEIFDYNAVYSADHFDADPGNPKPPNFSTLIYAQAPKVEHTWINITPNITLGSGIAVLFVHQSLTVVNLSGDNGFQLGDPSLMPYVIEYNITPHLTVTHLLNIFPKWGSYSHRHLVNAGLGFNSYIPELEMSYQPGHWEMSLDGWTGFNTTNPSTHYHTGNQFNTDYIVGFRPFFGRLPALQLAVNGYIYQQWTDDTQNGVRVGDGNRARAFAVGPSIRYDIGHGGLLVKWQHELGVQNKSSGEQVWFQFAIPL